MKIKPIKYLYPQRCRYCNNVTDIRRQVCHTCENTLQRIEGDICKLCGMGVDRCNCGKKKRFYKYICAPFYYKGAAARAIWNLKFNNKTRLAGPLAEDMAECFYTHYASYDFDICTFVPSSAEEIKNRGYNQAELLAKAFCEITQIRYMDLLVKNFSTQSQHKLSKVDRAGNLAGAIGLKDNAELTDMRVLLIDDIKTTGATLDECAKMLLLGGATEVFCLTVAITNKENSDSSEC